MKASSKGKKLSMFPCLCLLQFLVEDSEIAVSVKQFLRELSRWCQGNCSFGKRQLCLRVNPDFFLTMRGWGRIAALFLRDDGITR